MFRGFKIFIVLSWLAAMAYLFVAGAWEGKTAKPRPVTEEDRRRLEQARLTGGEMAALAGERWMGLFYKGKKIGYSRTLILPEEGGGYEVREDSLMQLNLMDRVRSVSTKSTSRVRDDLSLRSIEFSVETEGVGFGVRARVMGKNLFVTIDTAGEEREERIPLLSDGTAGKAKVYVPFAVRAYFFRRGVKLGDSFAFPVFDPSVMALRPMEIVVEGLEEIEVLGEKVKAYRLSQKFAGIRTTSWVDEKGETLKETAPGGMSLMRQGKEAAAEGLGEGAQIDILTSMAVEPDRPVKNPRKVRRLVVRLKGVELKAFDLGGANQELEGRVLTVTTPRPPAASYPLPYEGGGEPSRYLEPTTLVQSDAAPIRAEAGRIVKEGASALEAARRLAGWVEENLEKDLVPGVPSALEVLKTRRGDCNEHSTLFAALSRAAGLPARIAAGLVYLDGRFYYHAWNEVWLGKGWFPVDTTLPDQFPADATHLRFIVGGLDRQIDIMNLIGRLGVEVVEVD